MLSKRICMRCVNDRVFDKWTKAKDDLNWEHGVVDCVVGYKGNEDLVVVSFDPPERCPYALEHTIKEQ